MPMNKTPIVVMLGVHRSGTSLTARIFSELGLRLGDQLIPGHRDNPEGYWEHGGIVAQTRKIENELGVNPFSGYRLIPPDETWWESSPFNEQYERLKTILRKETSKNGMFGFKDPRTLLLLPMWKALFEDLGLEPRYILLLRHPAAVAASIHKRNGLHAKHSEFVWLNHISFGLLHLESPPVAVIHYEQWFQGTKKQLIRAALVVDRELDDLKDVAQGVRKFVNPKMAHYHGKYKNSELAESTRALYQTLSSLNNDEKWYNVVKQSQQVQQDNKLFAQLYEGNMNRTRRIKLRLEQKEEEIIRLGEQLAEIVSQPYSDPAQLDVEAVEPKPVAPYKTEFPDLRQFINRIDKPDQKMRVCIATEDIVGPIRNGGIGTTYTHLSKLLARAGHQVVIAYLRGSYCQNRTMKYWVDWYKEFGVDFVPVDPDKTQLECDSPRWVQPMHALYEYLKQESFNLVHVSEWRGSAYLSLLAKSLGLDFQKTVFCVKASSPWLWNREHGYHTIDRMADLPKMFAEKRSIELADMVISGSRYMLCWMLEHGYKLPRGRSYAQPNVMVPVDLGFQTKTSWRKPGKRTDIDEIVFFGRLEYRKGLDIFFDAINQLVIKKIKVPKITLMGKYGEKIPRFPELTIPEYIKKRSRKWPTKVNILSNFGNEDALRYLLGGNRLAVMPSIIENSSLAVYEAAYYGIPCIASDRGGTAELIDPRHHQHVLVEPSPIPLAAKIKEALSQGGFVPGPSFNNDHNLGVWLRFHGVMGAYVQDLVANAHLKNIQETLKVSICLVVCNNHEYAREVIAQIDECVDGKQAEFVIVNNGSTRKETINWLKKVQNQCAEACIFHECEGLEEQDAQNQAAVKATGDLLVFPETGTLLKPDFVKMVQQSASSSKAAVFGCFYDRIQDVSDIKNGSGVRCVRFVGDHTNAFYNLDYLSPVVVIRKDVFQELGGFRVDHKIPGASNELVSMAQLRNFGVETIPVSIAWHVENYSVNKRLNYNAQAYRSIRPFLELAPQCYKRILMIARNATVSTKDETEAKLSSGVTWQHRNDHLSIIEERARQVAYTVGSSPRLRNFGWKLYHLQMKIFRKFVMLEIRILKRILAAKQKFISR